MITDNTELLEEIRKLVEYNIHDEYKDYIAHVYEEYGVEIEGWPDDQVLMWAEENEAEDHIYITILKLWVYYGLDEEY